jgi:hypothetical protein
MCTEPCAAPQAVFLHLLLGATHLPLQRFNLAFSVGARSRPDVESWSEFEV